MRVSVCLRQVVCLHIKAGERERVRRKGRHRLSAGEMNLRPIYLMNEPLEGIHPQAVP